MTDVRPPQRSPGWHDDPSGDPGRLRWWDGGEWTRIVRARLPHERRPGSASHQSQLSGRGGLSGHPEVLDSEQSGSQVRWPWMLVLSAVGLVALLVLTGTFPGLGGQSRLPTTGAEVSPSLVPQPGPDPPSPSPVSGRFVDKDARLSYDVLPGRWIGWNLEPFQGLLHTAGYYRVLQENTPAGGLYWANVTSGQVGPGTAGRNDLPGTAGRLVLRLDTSYYPPHTRQQVQQRALTVDGRAAYLIQYEAIFDPVQAAGYTARSELVAVLVVDTGRELPSALYVSLPNTVRGLWPLLDGLLASVRVIR